MTDKEQAPGVFGLIGWGNLSCQKTGFGPQLSLGTASSQTPESIYSQSITHPSPCQHPSSQGWSWQSAYLMSFPGLSLEGWGVVECLVGETLEMGSMLAGYINGRVGQSPPYTPVAGSSAGGWVGVLPTG